MKLTIGKALTASLLFCGAASAFATAYTIPPPNEALIGKIQHITAVSGDTVITVAKKYDVGFNAMQNANPHMNMNRGFTPGVNVQIPTEHLLPDEPRQGIVINLPEMRMYYYPEGSQQVFTYPIGIGKIGKTIPITRTKITRKTKNPVWIPPEDIREFNLKQGIVLPQIMPPGPDNPLGPYAIYMSIPTYLIHSTIFPESVGTRASFGCIRMYESDIEKFFPSIKPGIPVEIINSPIKVGWEDNNLYIEAYDPLEEHSDTFSLPRIVHMLSEATKNQNTLIDWQAVSYISKEKDGLPHDVGLKLASS
jgi:L,D-transpeptidase ErfK/SrfK